MHYTTYTESILQQQSPLFPWEETRSNSPINADGGRHVDGAGHEDVGDGVEVGHRVGKDGLEVGAGQRRHGEQEEGADEQEVVERRKAAQDRHELGTDLQVRVSEKDIRETDPNGMKFLQLVRLQDRMYGRNEKEIFILTTNARKWNPRTSIY